MSRIIILETIIMAIITYSAIAESIDSMVAYEMKISLKQMPLPISISSLMAEHSVQKILIKMGHLTGNHNNFLFPKGIAAYISNKTQLSDDYLVQLKSLLQISQDKRFQLYLPQENFLLISDPNDRFCVEHIDYFLRYFYPCKNFASLGLQKLINPSKLLQKYLAFQFLWNVEDHQLQFKFIFPKEKQVQMVNKQTSCGNISVYELSSNAKDYKFSKSYQRNVMYTGQSINRWYSPEKCISHRLSFQQIPKQSRIKLITMLPLGFVFDNFTVHPQDCQHDFNSIQIGSSKYLIFTLSFPGTLSKETRIDINFHSTLPPFQTFQTIAGGGEELMNVALYFEDDKTHQLYSKIISQRLLQPDFSIPFETITFTVGIVGYLWINLWRIRKIKLTDPKSQ